MPLQTAGHRQWPTGKGRRSQTTGDSDRAHDSFQQPDEQTSETHPSVKRGLRRDRRRVEFASAQPSRIQKQIKDHVAFQLDDRGHIDAAQQIGQSVGGLTRATAHLSLKPRDV